jgi:hypothetical protein
MSLPDLSDSSPSKKQIDGFGVWDEPQEAVH